MVMITGFCEAKKSWKTSEGNYVKENRRVSALVQPRIRQITEGTELLRRRAFVFLTYLSLVICEFENLILIIIPELKNKRNREIKFSSLYLFLSKYFRTNFVL